MKENDVAINCSSIYCKKMLRATEVYLAKEKETIVVYFRKKSATGYDVIKIDIETLNIIKQDGEFSKEEIEIFKEHISTNEMIILYKRTLENTQELVSKEKEKQIKFFDEIYNYEYIDKDNNIYKLLNNLRYESNIVIEFYFKNIIGDFNVKFDEKEFNIRNVIKVDIYDEMGRKIINTKRIDGKKAANIINIEELKKCVIYVWELKEFHNIDSTKINVYNVHILYNGEELDILENVITNDMPPFLLAVSSGIKFGYTRKLDDNTFEYLKYNNGKKKSIKTSNNRFFSDEVLEYKNQPIKEEQLNSSFSASVEIELS